MSPLAPSNQNSLFGQSPNIDSLSSEKRLYSLQELRSLRNSTSGVPFVSDSYAFNLIRRASEAGNIGLRAPQIRGMGVEVPLFGTFRSNYIAQHGRNGNPINITGNTWRNRENPLDIMRNSSQSRESKSNALNRRIDIEYRIALNKKVQLKEAEKAWKPSHLQKSTVVEQDTRADLHRQVRSILNKLTAQNFAALSEQFQALPIDTTEKLGDVVNLVFEKAVDEPNFSACYAQLCVFLANRSKQMDESSECKVFKRKLIEKLQHEFEQNVANQHTMEAALKPLEERLKTVETTGDSGAIRETKELIAEEESRIRRRLVSTVGFIGELFKVDMLLVRIMNRCVQILIDHCTDEKLECACKLLTTIGNKLERVPIERSHLNEMGTFMGKFKQILERKKGKIATRTRFMIMELIELRANGWKKVNCV